MSLLVQPALHPGAGCPSHAVVKPGMGMEVCIEQESSECFLWCANSTFASSLLSRQWVCSDSTPAWGCAVIRSSVCVWRVTQCCEPHLTDPAPVLPLHQSWALFWALALTGALSHFLSPKGKTLQHWTSLLSNPGKACVVPNNYM